MSRPLIRVASKAMLTIAESAKTSLPCCQYEAILLATASLPTLLLSRLTFHRRIRSKSLTACPPVRTRPPEEPIWANAFFKIGSILRARVFAIGTGASKKASVDSPSSIQKNTALHTISFFLRPTQTSQRTRPSMVQEKNTTQGCHPHEWPQPQKEGPFLHYFALFACGHLVVALCGPLKKTHDFKRVVLITDRVWSTLRWGLFFPWCTLDHSGGRGGGAKSGWP